MRHTCGYVLAAEGHPRSDKEGHDLSQGGCGQRPGDPRAYAGLALGYTTLAHGADPLPDALSFARAAAQKAIQLDSTLDMAYAALGFIKGYHDWSGKQRNN